MPVGVASAAPSRIHSYLAKDLSIRRSLYLFLGNELEQRRAALLRLLYPPPDGGNDLGRIGDALAIAAERAGHARVIAADVGAAELLRRHRPDLQLDRP